MRLSTIAIRVAGAPTLLMRDLNLDEGGILTMIETANETLFERNPDDPGDVVFEAVRRAIIKAAPGFLEKLPKWFLPGEDSRGLGAPDLVHEMQHLFLDSTFDLINPNRGSQNHSKIESMMDEAFTAGMDGYIDEVAEGAYQASEDFLDKDVETVGELLDYIKNSPISTKEKKRIKDAVYSEIERTFGKYRDESLDNTTPNNHQHLKSQIIVTFLNGTVKRYDDRKNIMTDEMEDAWRRFVLHARNEIRKVLKNV